MLRRAFRPAPPAAAPPAAAAQSGNAPLAKEYIYAGGRLVATEEPASAVGPAPSGLSAVAASATSVAVSWSAPASGAVASYTVERGETMESISTLASNLSGDSYTDASALVGKVYLYRVRAVFQGGATSGHSNVDLATTIVLSDDPLIPANDPQNRPATRVRAAHLTELRDAVDAVRVAVGIGEATWQGSPAPQAGGPIRAAHFVELRDNLNPALAALDLETLPNDPTLGVGLPVRAAHVQDVRDKLR
jgi:hypothetical protein